MAYQSLTMLAGANLHDHALLAETLRVQRPDQAS
jgi:hypothetical protein